MEKQAIVNIINAKLAGELLSFNELLPLLDETIDEINSNLNSCYPVFSEMETGKSDYNYFPDRYIRTVVVPGAVWRYLVLDEEGIPTAMQYQIDYQTGLFTMMRDMLYNIPEEYQADYQQGTVQFEFDNTKDNTQGGLYIDGTNYLL